MNKKQLNIIVSLCVAAAFVVALHSQTPSAAQPPPLNAASFNAHYQDLSFALQPGQTSEPFAVPAIGHAFRVIVSFTKITLREGSGTEPPFEGGLPPFFIDLLCLQESPGAPLKVRTIPSDGVDIATTVALGDDVPLFSITDFPFRLQLQSNGTFVVRNVRNGADGYSVCVHIALWY